MSYNSYMLVIENIVAVFFPLLLSVLVTRWITDPPGRRIWRSSFLAYFTATLYFVLLTKVPNLIKIYFSLKTDLLKIAYRVVLLPILKIVFYQINRANSTWTPLKKINDDILISLPFLLMSELFDCFFQTRMSSYFGLVGVTAALIVKDFLMKWSLMWREKRIDLYLFCMNKEMVEKKYASVEYFDHTSRTFLIEMLVSKILPPSYRP